MHKKECRRKQPLFFVLLWIFTKLVETLRHLTTCTRIHTVQLIRRDKNNGAAMTHLKGGRTHYTYYRHFDPDFFLCDHYFYILETRGIK